MTTPHPAPPSGLRIVAYCVLPPAYQILSEWATRHEHRILLLVTSPGPPTMYSEAYKSVLAMVPPTQDVLVTTRPKRTAALVRALQPDLVLSFSFPYRLPTEVLTAARIGAVNLHPTPLPRYRGPNPLRLLYDNHPEIGSALHWTDAAFDTGPILSTSTRPLPEEISGPSVLPLWLQTMADVLEEGVPRAVARAPGTPQDESIATYAGAFSEAERLLDWSLTVRELQCRTLALAMVAMPAAVSVDGATYRVKELVRADPDPTLPLGVARWLGGEDALVGVGDGTVRVTLAPLP